MKLPGGDRAVVPPGKLLRYALNLEHHKGGDIAHVFRAALSLTDNDAPLLEVALLRAANDSDATLTFTDEYGRRFRVDFVLEHQGRSAVVRSGWLVPVHGGATSLATVFVLRQNAAGIRRRRLSR